MFDDLKIRVIAHQTKKHTPLNDQITYYDLTFVITGNMDYVINGSPVHLTTGSTIVMPPNSVRYRYPAYNSDVEYYSINFFCNENINLPLVITNSITPEIHHSLRLCNSIHKKHGTYSTERVELIVKEMIYGLKEIYERNDSNPHIKAINEYIDSNLTKQLTLEDIAFHVSLSPSYCATLVKKETGHTIFDMIIKKRIELAQNYIIENKKSLQEISVLCGYNDYSYFSRHFKRCTGFPPSRMQDKK